MSTAITFTRGYEFLVKANGFNKYVICYSLHYFFVTLTFLITGKIKHSEATLYFVHVDFIVRHFYIPMAVLAKSMATDLTRSNVMVPPLPIIVDFVLLQIDSFLIASRSS